MFDIVYCFLGEQDVVGLDLADQELTEFVNLAKNLGGDLNITTTHGTDCVIESIHYRPDFVEGDVDLAQVVAHCSAVVWQVLDELFCLVYSHAKLTNGPLKFGLHAAFGDDLFHPII